MEFYVQALFRVRGFSPCYLAFLDYTHSTAPTTADMIDSTTGLRPLQNKGFREWNVANPQRRKSLLLRRGLANVQAIRLGFQIDFQATSDTNFIAMAPVYVSC